MAVLEATINEKKRQVEKLVADMKEANLQSLAISPPEELKMILDGECLDFSTFALELSLVYYGPGFIFSVFCRCSILKTRQYAKNDWLAEAIGKRCAYE